MKDIEAWLMQTDGELVITSDLQSPFGQADLAPASGTVLPAALVQPQPSSLISEAANNQPLSDDILGEAVGPTVDLFPVPDTLNSASSGVTTISVLESMSDSWTAADNQQPGLCDSGGKEEEEERTVEVCPEPASRIGSVVESQPRLVKTIADDDYVDEQQLMGYLRQLELERSEELLLMEAEAAVSDGGEADSSLMGARPKVRSKENTGSYICCFIFKFFSVI